MPVLHGIGDLEIILITVAVLFEPVTVSTPIAETDALKVLKRPVNLAQSMNGSLIISSNRDQKEIVISPNKIDARDTSEDIDEAKTRLPELLRYFLDLIGNPTLKTLGINFVLEAEAIDTQRWLADKTISASFREQITGPISSKSISVTFERSDQEWTLTFSAPTPERISVNFNASKDMASLPSETDLSNSIKEQFSDMEQYLAGLT